MPKILECFVMQAYSPYYSILPENVHHCSDLTSGAKLLFADINNLARKKGFCWATNKYLSSLLDVTERAISKWLKALKSLGFIEIITRKKGLVWERKIEIKKISPKGTDVHDRREQTFHITRQPLNKIIKEKQQKKESADAELARCGEPVCISKKKTESKEMHTKPPEDTKEIHESNHTDHLIKTPQRALKPSYEASEDKTSDPIPEIVHSKNVSGLPESIFYAKIAKDDNELSTNVVYSEDLVNVLRQRSLSDSSIIQAINTYQEKITPVRNLVSYLCGIAKKLSNGKSIDNKKEINANNKYRSSNSGWKPNKPTFESMLERREERRLRSLSL